MSCVVVIIDLKVQKQANFEEELDHRKTISSVNWLEEEELLHLGANVDKFSE